MDQSNSPPVTHVLKPHHVGILLFLIVYFRGLDWGEIGRPPRPLNSKVKQVMLVVLAREIGEINPPTPYAELVAKMDMQTDNAELRQEFYLLRYTLTEVVKVITRPEVLGDLMSDARNTVAAGTEEAPEEGSYVFERRSFFGMFVRRCFLSFRKLSFAGQVRLLNDFVAWWSGCDAAGYELSTADRINGLQIYPVIFDLLELSKPEYYTESQAALKAGESNTTTEKLRRFFDQRFAMSDDSMLYQHALLSMARMHYAQGELHASRLFLDEAVKASREKNDSITLDSCQSLMKRLNPDPATSFLAHDRRATIKAGLTPLDVLWEVKRLLDLGEGIQICFVKVYESIGVYDARLRSNLGVEKWPRHAVMAILWRLAGVESLAALHERIIATFVPVGDDDSRITALCSQAYSLTRQGKRDDALELLLDPQTWRGLNFRQYSNWALQVWKVFDFTAQRRGQHRLRDTFLKANKPPEPNVTQLLGSAQTFLNKRTALVDCLREAQAAKSKDLAVPAIKPLMQAIWSAETRGMFGLYRIAVVLLADIGLDLNLSLTCLSWLEEIFPQILLGDDLELRAYASMTYARCILASGGKNVPEAKLKETRPHLIRAIKDYRTISLYEQALEALYTLSVVCHNLDSLGERDSWATQFQALEQEYKKAVAAGVEDEMIGAFWVVREAGHIIGVEDPEAERRS